MNESDAHHVLWLRAIEEHDRRGSYIPRRARLDATRQADPPATSPPLSPGETLSPEEQAFLVRRAHLLKKYWQEHPILRPPVSDSRRQSLGLFGAATLIAFLSGLASNELGAARTINILAFPMLGMLFWNAIIYLILLFQWIASICHRSSAGTGPIQRWVLGKLLPAPDQSLPAPDEDHGAARIREAFLRDWMAAAHPLYLSRIRSLLHLCAVMVTFGIITGMYARGLVLEYRASWESTFLDSQQVHRIVATVLAPASALARIPVPSPAEIAAIRATAPGSGGPAANWIHLYAATGLLFVALPRTLLLAAESWRRNRARRNFPIPGRDNPYISRLLQIHGGGTEGVLVVPHCLTLANPKRERIREIALELFGWEASVEFSDPVPYGAEDDLLKTFSECAASERRILIVFSLATTPESENQGALIGGLKSLIETRHIAGALLILIDSAPLEERQAGLPDAGRRLEERHRLWERFISGHGLPLALCSLDENAPPPSINTLRQAIWNPHPAEPQPA